MFVRLQQALWSPFTTDVSGFPGNRFPSPSSIETEIVLDSITLGESETDLAHPNSRIGLLIKSPSTLAARIEIQIMLLCSDYIPTWNMEQRSASAVCINLKF